jgi:hypothetical protein
MKKSYERPPVIGTPATVRASDLVTDDVLDEAYRWLCENRSGWPASADVWSLRWKWAEERERIRAEILEGRYRFDLLSRVTIKAVRRSISGQQQMRWS